MVCHFASKPTGVKLTGECLCNLVTYCCNGSKASKFISKQVAISQCCDSTGTTLEKKNHTRKQLPERSQSQLWAPWSTNPEQAAKTQAVQPVAAGKIFTISSREGFSPTELPLPSWKGMSRHVPQNLSLQVRSDCRIRGGFHP